MDDNTAVAVEDDAASAAQADENTENVVEVRPGGTSPIRPRLLWVDPRALLANPRNVRTDLGDLTELRDGIAESGVWQALVGTPDDDGITLIMGHRRAAAAALAVEELGAEMAAEVPVLVHEALAGATAEQIAAMLQENVHRKALTATEEANGYHQLTLEGWSTEEIAKRTGRRQAAVQRSLVLARQSDAIQTAVDAGDLTLEDAVAIAAFESDPKACQRIASKNGQWAIRHQISEEQRKRRIAAEVETLTAEMAGAGVVVVKKPKGYPYNCREVEATALRDSDGNVLVAKEVWNKPGFAAFIDTASGTARAVVICLNPDAHDYERRYPHMNTYVTPEEAERREQQKAAEAARREALTSAAEVRAKFLVETYGSAKAAKRVYVDALRDVLASPRLIENVARDRTLVKALTGTEPDAVDLAEAGEARLTRLLVGLWIAGQEYNMADVALARFGARPGAALAWLERLATAGYGLSDAEQALRDDLAEQMNACDDCGAKPGEAHDGDCASFEEADDQGDDEPTASPEALDEVDAEGGQPLIAELATEDQPIADTTQTDGSDEAPADPAEADDRELIAA